MVFLLVSPDGFSFNSKLKELEAKINQKDYKGISSVLISRNGRLEYEKYFGDGKEKHLNDIRSASKSITAVLFGIASQKGFVKSTSQKVLDVFPERQSQMHHYPLKQEIRFSDLLSMSSTLECDDWNQFSAGNEERMYLRSDWIQFVLDLPEKGIPPWETPIVKRKYKRAFSYCTAGVFLIGAAIERQTKMSLKDFAHNYLFGPLGIEHVRWPMSPTGIFQGGGGLRISSRDLIKIGELMVNRGKYKEKRIVNEAWIDEMLTPRVVALADREIEYGYLWWIMPFKRKEETVTVYAASGNGGNYLFFLPSEKLVAVITATAFNTDYMHQQSQEIFANYILSE